MESEGNNDPKAIEQDTANCKGDGNKITDIVKLTSIREAEPNASNKENIAEKAEISNPGSNYTSSPPEDQLQQNVIKSTTKNNDFLHSDSYKQRGMDSNIGSSDDQFPQKRENKVFNILHW